ncbi:MAG: MBOAT family O-acyltransferase, partial [Bacteroidota bacterium]|nr:MBOAT family O-acyltransferase [Bacteroidota bacterium]
IEFLLFFVVVTGGYFLLPQKFRWLWLLLASCYFYMAFVPIYILILAFTIIVDFLAGIVIEQSGGHRRKCFLAVSLIANIGVLAFFKYYNFLNNNLTVLLHDFQLANPVPALTLLLPIGLSFHTFQAMSYTIEVYRGNQKAERHPGIYALYVMFYPQLVAGPIERPQHLLKQFRETHTFDYDRVTSGLKLMAWGLFKKVVIADRLAILVDTVYDHPANYNSLSLIIATVFFSFQIYCDFSGYTDMAIGAARVMGFRLMQNFNAPYRAKNFQEFWQRWHISLSTWLRDYLYIPLGGNRVSNGRHKLNIAFVFLICGLWHGANWTFIVWGGLHGLYRIVEIVSAKQRKAIGRVLRFDKFPFIPVFITYCLASFAWIFFRADTLQQAMFIIRRMVGNIPDLFRSGQPVLEYMGLTRNNFLLSIALILSLEVAQTLKQRGLLKRLLHEKPVIVRWSLYYCLLLAIIFLGVFESRQFIYFQF